jgi:hypothetical protein
MVAPVQSGNAYNFPSQLVITKIEATADETARNPR